VPREIPKSCKAMIEKSSSVLGRIRELTLASPMIALNVSRVGHNSTPLN